MSKPITEEDGVHLEWYEARPKTPQELADFVTSLFENYRHDYGTCVHAVAASALAAAWTANEAAGLTGYQAGFVMWEFVRRWLSIEGPTRLVQYDDMLFPQYESKFDKSIPASVWQRLQEQAAAKLAKESDAEKELRAAPTVRAHWQSIVDGKVPFGYRVEGE